MVRSVRDFVCRTVTSVTAFVFFAGIIGSGVGRPKPVGNRPDSRWACVKCGKCVFLAVWSSRPARHGASVFQVSGESLPTNRFLAIRTPRARRFPQDGAFHRLEAAPTPLPAPPSPSAGRTSATSPTPPSPAPSSTTPFPAAPTKPPSPMKPPSTATTANTTTKPPGNVPESV